MKKLALSLLLILIAFSTNAQDNDLQSFKKNELKLNAISLIIGAADIAYERLLNNESGVGLSVFITYDDEIISSLLITGSILVKNQQQDFS